MEITQQRIVFTKDLNNHNTLFGGKALQWMDEVAYIAAKNYTKNEVVTVSIDTVKFLFPIKPGDIIELRAIINNRIRNLKFVVQIEVYILNFDSKINKKAIYGEFTLAAINKNHQPIALKNLECCINT